LGLSKSAHSPRQLRPFIFLSLSKIEQAGLSMRFSVRDGPENGRPNR
jgi:hypothetical protein